MLINGASKLSLLGKCSNNNYQVYCIFYNVFIGGFKEWKIRAFKAVGELLDKSTITNIVALGDS